MLSSEKQKQKINEFRKIYLTNWIRVNSPSYRYFNHKPRKCPTQMQLFKLAQRVSNIAQQKYNITSRFEDTIFKRAASRNKDVCFKWFDENFWAYRDILDNDIYVHQHASFSKAPSSQNHNASHHTTSNLSPAPFQNPNTSNSQDNLKINEEGDNATKLDIDEIESFFRFNLKSTDELSEDFFSDL